MSIRLPNARAAAPLVVLLAVVAAACATPAGPVLVRDGRGTATVYVDAAAPADVTSAVEVLQEYVERISGARLPVTRDPTARGSRIVIEVGSSGDPRLDLATLGDDGFRIKTVGRDLVLSARTADGLRNAVYTFLETHLGCRKYAVNVETVPRAATIALPAIDDTQVPPLAFRMQDIHDPAYVAWHKLDTNDDFGLFVHTFEELVPPAVYFAEHPEYFSLLNGVRTPHGQLCLSNPAVYDVVVAALRRRMREKPDATFWSVSQNDTYVPCGCDGCKALDDAAGGPAGSIVAFVNRLAAEFPDRTISTLAYQYSRAAPRGVTLRPNVNVMLCSIECNRSRPIAADPGSASFVQDLRDWAALTDNIFLWDYVIQFRNLVSPFPNLRVLQPNLQFFVESGVTRVFEQGLPVMYGEFAELRIYLLAKLLWDPSADVDAIVDDFLQGFYGAAAPFVREYIDTMHDALEASGEGLDIFGYPAASADGHLSPARMDAYEALFARAAAAVADDPEVLTRVQTAHLPVQFARLEQAKVAGAGERGAFGRGSDGALAARPDFEALLALFVARCKHAGIPRLRERGTSPDEYLAATRRFVDESTTPHLAVLRPVALGAPASPQYRGGDANALTDGIKGWDDYHAHWLGFQGTDLVATVDLGAVRPVAAVETDFLQDINSWIFMPLRVTVALSADGQRFREVGIVENELPAETAGAVVAPFDVRFAPTDARYVRVLAASRKRCPDWHKGSGGAAWIFVDEIAVR